MELITNKSPISHPHAKTFKYATKIDGGTMIDVLEVGIDLAFEGWSETEEGKSLCVAIDAYLCGGNCRVKRVDVFPVGGHHA